MFQISLKAARVNADLRQTDVANAIGVDVATIINWEKGKTAPRSDQLKKLCDIYGTPMDFIFLSRKYALSERIDTHNKVG